MNNCEQHCDCVFTKEEIEKYPINNYGNFVDLTKQPSYRMPSGSTREKRRKYMQDVLEVDSDKGHIVADL